MELRKLIAETNELNEQLRQLKAQEINLKEKIASREKEIKAKLDETGEDYADLSEEEFQQLMANLGDPMRLIVEVVYATNNLQLVTEVQVERGATVEDGIMLSGILDKTDEIDLAVNKVGIHGVIKPLTATLSDGDRIEIYRPVTAKT
jgi:putative ubiquitin-RnfH superfamily antitoxin RatB of RatAB toxin-antitoxin module